MSGAALAGVLIFDTLPGLFIGIVTTEHPRARGRGRDQGRGAGRRDGPLRRRHRGAQLGLLAADLRRQGVQFLLAGDVGQVRDVLAGAAGDELLVRAYPTVREAVAAVRVDGNRATGSDGVSPS